MKSKGVLLILSCLLVTSLFFLFVGEPSSSSSSTTSSSSAASSIPSSTSDRGWVALPLRRSKQVVTSSSDSSSSSSEERKSHHEPSSYSNHLHPNEVPRHVEVNDWGNRIQGEKRELNSQQEIEEELSSPGEDEVVNRALESLGFTSASRTYARDVWTNISLPVVVTAVTSQMEDEEITKFILRFHDSFPNFLLIIYTVSLDEKEFDSVSAMFYSHSLLSLSCPVAFPLVPSHSLIFIKFPFHQPTRCHNPILCVSAFSLEISDVAFLHSTRFCILEVVGDFACRSPFFFFQCPLFLLVKTASDCASDCCASDCVQQQYFERVSFYSHTNWHIFSFYSPAVTLHGLHSCTMDLILVWTEQSHSV